MRVLLAQPRGFCAGVVRAIDIVNRSLEKFGAPVYVRHEIVHNRHVVETLERRGAVFVESLAAKLEAEIHMISVSELPAFPGTMDEVIEEQDEGRRRLQP